MLLAGQPSGQLEAGVRTADRIDYWIRRRVHATDLAPSNLWPAQDRPHRSRVSGAPHSKLFPVIDRSIWLSIGNCLSAQYDALAPPMPPHIAALVEQLETGEQMEGDDVCTDDACTKAALARLRPGSTCCAGDRNRHH